MKLWRLIPLMLVVSGANAQTDCNLKLDKDSIKVYTCAVSKSKFRSVKTNFTVNARMSQLVNMILDIDQYHQWQYKTVSAKLLKQVSAKEIIYHTEVEAPVIVNNRDFIIRLTINQNPKTRELIIEAVSMPDYLPPVKGVVRVPFSKAKWTIKPITATKLSVEYYIEIDLGGSIPPRLVNLVAHEAPYETFKSLKKNIDQYKDRKVSFIKD